MSIIRLVLHHNNDVIYVLHYNLQHLRIINTSTRLNTHLISICGIGIPKMYLAKKPMFGNWPSWLCHKTRWSTCATIVRNNLLNKYNSPTYAHENSSIKAATSKMLSYSSIKSLDLRINPSIGVAHAWIIG
jgi:hypothetical protein